MIDPTARLSVSRQALVLGISRGSVYYTPRPVSDADLKLMHRIDKLHMEFPFAGSRMLQGLLVQEGFKVGRLHVATLMKRMGIAALYRKPNTSKPARPCGAWLRHDATRSTPICCASCPSPGPIRSGRWTSRSSGKQSPGLFSVPPHSPWRAAFGIGLEPMATNAALYLAAVLDWFTRRVLAWRVSITLEADFCIEAVEEALARHGTPEIFNTDQGSQFTSTDFIKVLAAREIKISMDGKGAWRDNVFVERLWRSIKYEEVYLRGHVRHVGPQVGNFVDIEEPRAGDMGVFILRRRIAPCIGQIPRGIKDAQIGVAQMGGQPIGGHQRAGVIGELAGHWTPGQDALN